MRHFRSTLTGITVAVLLVACGGSDDNGVTSVKVMGDSLADSGVYANIPGFGRIFSVQASDAEPYTIWSERVAKDYGLAALCNVYQYTGVAYVANSKAGCTSYGVGGARISNFGRAGGDAVPQSIIKQLQDARPAGTSYTDADLLLIDGGGNDAAALISDYLAASQDGGAAFSARLGSLLPAAILSATFAGANGSANAGNLYMIALADRFFDAIKSNALDRGATRVALLNMPDVSKTPRFQVVLNSVAAASGGGSAGAAVRAQLQGLVGLWVQTFNAQLQTRAVGQSRLKIVDFYTEFNAWFTNPAAYGLSNVSTPACPATGVDGDGLPSYTFQTCTAAALSAQTPPTGASGGANWWKTYAFSDNFHPTPYGHQLMGQMVNRTLKAAGWL